MKAKKKGINEECPYCKKVFYKNKKSKTKYCSKECWIKSIQGKEKPLRKNGVTKKCIVCEKPFYVSKIRKDTAIACSVECANIHQRSIVKKIEKRCLNCDKKFDVYPSREKQSLSKGEQIKFCSLKCRDESPITKKLRIRANNIGCKKANITKLELAGREILKEIGVKFEEQVLIEDSFTVDVFIKDCNLIIEWDGDYWHGHTSKLKDGMPDKRQKEIMERDVKRDKILRGKGVNVLRIWEHDVYENKGGVSENIKRTISKITK